MQESKQEVIKLSSLVNKKMAERKIPVPSNPYHTALKILTKQLIKLQVVHVGVS